MSGRDPVPKFAVLDVVSILRPADQAGLGVIWQIRWYVEGHYRYCIGSLDPADEAMGGIYDEADLTGTGKQAPIEHFWADPSMARQIVRVLESHPEPELRGLVGQIEDPLDSDDAVYSVIFMTMKKGFELTTRARDIPAEFLEPVGHRRPPEPVPRPITTYRPGRDETNVWPSHEFDIIDELDQYL